MWMSQPGAMGAEPEPTRFHFISHTIAVAIARWSRLRKDPLFVVLFVWIFLFLLAAIIFAET